MPRHRARSTRSTHRIVGGAAVVGTAMVALGGAAQASTLDLPDLAPLLTAHNDVQPAPAPTAPPVESSYTAFDSTDPINQLRDFTPAGLPLTGLVDSAAGAPKKLIPSNGGGSGSGGSGAGYE